MKKLFALTLALVLALSLAACGSNNDNRSTASGNIDSSTTASSTSQGETEDSSVSSDVSGDEYPFATPIIPDGLSSNADSFQISLDGNILTLPALYSDFTALGWTCDRIDGETLKPGFIMTGNAALKKGDATLSGANFINLSDEELPLSECYVYGFAFAYDTKGAVSTSFVLPGGLHIGSTIDDITAAYGEPTETDDSSATKTKLTYKSGDENYITFEIDKKQPPYWNRIAIYREENSSN